MEFFGESLRLSASDLIGHINCRYLTQLDLRVARGALSKSSHYDPAREVLIERGRRHEQGYLDHLRALGREITTIDGFGIDSASVAATIAAIKEGADVIAQAALQSGEWVGRADVLLRVEKPSRLGAWTYEIVDTKLSQETKGSTLLQLTLYADLLGSVQGAPPDKVYVVTPETGFEAQEYRVADFAAYYRWVRWRLEQAVAAEDDARLYPEPTAHCEICRWRQDCESRRRADDHLSLVAGISKGQIGELGRHAVGTTTALAAVPLPLPWKPERGAKASYERIREQARLQVEGRAKGQVLHEVLPIVPGFGLCTLPAPSAGDVFLDFEGDPFVSGGGLEYLFGYVLCDEAGGRAYTGEWALTREAEKAAFESFIDLVMERLERWPDLHIYHYAPYEPAALKRLMGRYATRENEIDHLLRSGAFVDLYAVTRHSIRASIESYSIKRLEPLYGFERSAPLADVGRLMTNLQACLELGYIDGIRDEDRALVQAYNQDDCLSALGLRDWLEGVRSAAMAGGADIPRPVFGDGAVSEALSEWQQKVAMLVGRLTAGISVEPGERSDEEKARWLLAHVLDWHRREEKTAWWEYFRLGGLSEEDLLDERAALSGLTFLEQVGGTTRAPVHRYSFPAQETELRGDEELHNQGNKFGKVDAISVEGRTVDIKKRQDTKDVHASAVYAHKVIDSKVLAEALVRIGEHVAANGIEGNGPYRAARDLLLRVAPEHGGQELQREDETPVEAAVRLAPQLAGCLPIQGPPGAGKTYTGAQMICALVQAGKKVGVTANSHKVVRNLLDGVVEAARARRQTVRCIQKVSDTEADTAALEFTTKNDELLAAIADTHDVAGGTAWLWARADAAEAVDVLFIDEAAQMSLANVLAVSQAAESIVLLGDPRQLEQPMQGSHPEGTDVSALDHILGEHATIPADRGLFLAETWRLHPDICSFTSEMFYEGRLFAHPGLERQAIRSTGPISGSGLRYLAVPHQGNQSSSPEEAEAIKELVERILRSGTTWVDRDDFERPVSLEDILIIAPYNAQVFELQDRLHGARIGTVDKFQGQEAPIVIYSMTTSSHADAPRGMEFLYSANRLNVATSRAKCLCVLVAAPAVFEAECRTPGQMRLANAFCRYLERSTSVD
ncbi:TM0106 family RecB-like putative nuclease [Reyranella sp.]|uniref:TM0106 family RecB-like putative nuclease n=1 Tax=Reyranella sp. TaxID=1929291 RepID=UPI003BA98423